MTIYSDFPENGDWSFQDPASPWMFAIVDLNERVSFYLIIILTVVSWFIIKVTLFKDVKNFPLIRNNHGNTIELGWTLAPAFILWCIGLPSLKLLYLMDEILEAEITVKVQGQQWYWTYEYSDYINSLNETISFDSFMVDEYSLELGDLRNLTVDNYLVLPVNTNIRILTTSTDVIHCFAVPSLAMKLDAIPGRLNTTGLLINRKSTFYGQCSELCGVLHGMMPIGVKAVNVPQYLNFLASNS